MTKANTKTIAHNKKVSHDYFIIESMEAGIELKGTEVKSLRAGRVNLKDSWCSVVDGEIFINGMHISPYEQVPVSVYFKNSRIKIQVGLCKGKKLYDKRADIAAKDAKRNIERHLKEQFKQ